MDAFAHLRIERGRVRLIESGAGVRIEITGMMINESITIEVGHCQTIEVKPLSMVHAKTLPETGFHKESDGIVGLTARRGHGLGRRDAEQ